MNLHFRVNIDDLYTAFKPYGELTHCRMMINERHEPKGYAFLTFKRESEARKAVDMMDGFKMYGRKISASISTGKTAIKNPTF